MFNCCCNGIGRLPIDVVVMDIVHMYGTPRATLQLRNFESTLCLKNFYTQYTEIAMTVPVQLIFEHAIRYFEVIFILTIKNNQHEVDSVEISFSNSYHKLYNPKFGYSLIQVTVLPSIAKFVLCFLGCSSS